MKKLLIAAMLFSPGVAVAQGCIGCVSSGPVIYGCIYSQCTDTGDSFTTTHAWKKKVPGTLVLEGTGFTITFGALGLTYYLKWRDQDIEHGFGLDALKRTGVARAVDMQAIGQPLG